MTNSIAFVTEDLFKRWVCDINVSRNMSKIWLKKDLLSDFVITSGQDQEGWEEDYKETEFGTLAGPWDVAGRDIGSE